jgi:HPt (histidine-containing phosphotransfer) domain-containing protein
VEPVDLRHLSAQTGGDRKLEREVVLLFIDDTAAQLARLSVAAGEERRGIAHRLLGSARAIGAAEVARCAAAIEAGSGDVEGLAAAVDDARRFLQEYLARKS